MAGQFFQNPLGSKGPAPDGPARVVKGAGMKPVGLAEFGAKSDASRSGKPGTILSSDAAVAKEKTLEGSPDWKGVPGHAMRGFSLRNFGGPAKPMEDDSKLAELRAALHKSEEARRKAVEDAKDEMVQMAKAALAEGMEKGRIEGEAEALAKYQKQLQSLRSHVEAALQALSREKAEAFLAFERMAVEMFNACLLRVFQSLPEWNDEVVTSLLRQSIATLNGQTALTVRVHPDDFKVVQEKRSFWETLETAALDIHFEADGRVGRGGCLIEAGATSAGADPLAFAEQVAQTIREVHQARLDHLRRGQEDSAHD